MARTKDARESSNPQGISSRLRPRPPRQSTTHQAKVAQKEDKTRTNGARASTSKRKTHPTENGTREHERKRPRANDQPTTSHRQRRKPGIGEKLSGAMMIMKGEATAQPAVKAAGTRRMHGTDGRRKRR